ncbi:MAG: DUF4136 domain-containing protein [Cyclobacteriaceae bacterium]|nr:DUF4136 domain-containing protein [Cyclobacteriaceae bacterium]
MKSNRFILFLILMVGCNNIQTAYDQEIDFSKYRTFCWLEGCQFTFTGPEYLQDSVIQVNIRKAIIDAMKSKGYVYDDNNPDLLIDFHVVIENEKVITYHNREDEPYYYRMTFMTPQEVMLTKGTVMLHMVDRAQSIVVWQSQLLGYMDSGPEISRKNIQRGVRQLLKNFPPDQKKSN